MALYLVLIAAVMLAAAFVSMIWQDRPTSKWHSELKDLIYEAQVAREDLEAMLQNVQIAGEEVVKTLDQAITERYDQMETTLADAAAKTEGKSPPPPPFSLEDMRRAHPYIMASRLKEMGYTIVQIAEYLDRSTGEIELALSLADRKQKIG